MSMEDLESVASWVKELLRDPVKRSERMGKLEVELQKYIAKFEAEINKKGKPSFE